MYLCMYVCNVSKKEMTYESLYTCGKFDAGLKCVYMHICLLGVKM